MRKRLLVVKWRRKVGWHFVKDLQALRLRRCGWGSVTVIVTRRVWIAFSLVFEVTIG